MMIIRKNRGEKQILPRLNIKVVKNRNKTDRGRSVIEGRGGGGAAH